MNSKEITEISPFFQLPNYESKQELIFFPTSIYLDDKKYVNISYNIGDNRSYFLRLHLDIINISLYDKFSVDFQLNHNINQNYYLELVRNIRKSLGYPVQKKKYYGQCMIYGQLLQLNIFLIRQEFRVIVFFS